MDILRFAAFGIIAAVLAVTLRRESPVFAALVSLAAGALLLLAIAPKLALVVDGLSGITGRLGDGARYVAVVLKIIGIAYVAEFGAEMCRDANETALAAKIELAGKVLILIAAMPVITAMLEIVTTLAE